MLIAVPDLLSAAELADVRAIIDAAEWIDGNATSGHQAALAKNNEQLPEDGDAARQAGRLILEALGRSPIFFAAALPLRIYPPLFNRYGAGQEFDTHVDNAIRIKRGSDFRIRSDLSITVFLEAPEDYDGGELLVEDHYGVQRVKLPAGHAVVYPSSSLHRVTPITRGRRVASFFWLQSMVRSAEERRTLFDLDRAVQRLTGELGGKNRSVIELTGVYHNLLRLWADS
ncbi:Fe2+-dependent dioxygenase [Sphingopyxis sp. RIFCSPHIGHO2_12_FULL_65_19]|uniref:Fe2+-dependent dioxygenase n=1 Tax=Sphingopyxis sp. RIFCSPHIGHO2_12_FULL_65_19 TaxID=1802172 RepID=UPI0008BDCDD0|nr:Fe2+-dependent dioxygenase [Sphingopyxis sp. RIFCSPHIGHO2_12_FULL_65_19]OHD06454.1 MAG: Fe2+-dependent dioxygenase [Sphingopyxis sp. RIFCSPHIGHO2_12_FULL_65_19]